MNIATPQMDDYFPENRSNGLEWPHSQIMLVENHRLLFCPIAKNACSSLKRLMVSISAIEHKELMLAGDIHHSIDAYRTGAKLLDLSLEQARQIMSSNDYFKFAVIRDPFARLVSAYLEKFVINRANPGNQRVVGPTVAAVQSTATPDFERGITFDDFIRYITAQEPERLNPHWRPQTLYLRGVSYDRIYRMENLAHLKHDLEARTGRRLDLEHRNRSHSGRPKYVPGVARLLPNALPTPKNIDKHSFMDSEIMFRIVSYFEADYRLYFSDDVRNHVDCALPPAEEADLPRREHWFRALRRKLPPTHRD